ncbi:MULTISPECIES: SpoIID/LytB domain-containing protein [Paenibacillus]|uniref:SpoIID/LytB domain-containing protein n=1 Tax=Paenibacillus TaxID=44249 RepID=UPI0022B89901|nr:SpoIID/LytB domain-containing protein [Paenibacillus caseinilyticus]MCZ8519058.1 SpoIID/LytB domain-containing protein [Paenibacillus caseinilyticus]
MREGKRPRERRAEAAAPQGRNKERPVWRTVCRTQRGTGAAFAAAVLAVTGSLGLVPGQTLPGSIPAVQAAVAPALTPVPERIRVALFIDTGKYVSPASAVTLSAEAGLELSLRGSGGGTLPRPAPGTAGGAVRVYADGYYAQLPETASAAEASSQAARLAAGGAGAGVVQHAKRGAAAYRAYLGPFPTKEAAAAAAAKQPGAVVAGPHYASAGSYASLTEAQAAVSAIGQAGFDADPALTGTGYAVFVGGTADPASLEALKAQIAAAVPGLALTPVDASQGYAIRRSGLSGAAPADAYAVGGGAKLWAEPAGGAPAGIKVEERYERAYRGGIEVSLHNGKLAVINELPFEEYLYAVLGSELGAAWPAEALKAQAVAARTYALKQGMKYGIAHISDTTTDQAYKGISVEFPGALEAVKATQGEVLTYGGALIDPLFYSNAGGKTAESTEVWGNPVPYLKSAASPDEGAQSGKKMWYRIVTPDGRMGYIRSDYARAMDEKNPAGLPYYEGNTTGTNVRGAPYVDDAGNPSLFKVDIGDRFVVIGETVESNAYTWLRGPFDARTLKEKLGAAVQGSVQSLEVTERGPSGRATGISVNGQPVKAAYPDSLRTLLGGLPSTRFEIEETGRYTIQGAGGTVRNRTPGSGPVYMAGGTASPQQSGGTAPLFVLNGTGQVRAATEDARFVFKGTGFGHGLGMSQWGAKGYAEQGLDYKAILQTYYTGTAIAKP